MILFAPGTAELAETAQPAPGAAEYRYYAYGMRIHSQLELAELQPFESAVADLTIRRENLRRPLPADGEAVFEFGAQDAYLGFGGVGHFALTGSDVVSFEPCPGRDDPAALKLFLLGSVLAAVLHRRRLLTLHASGIDLDGRGVIFMGNKGAGKSTTAAAFIRAGHRLLTDDVLAIALADDGGHEILPGFPQIKLTEAAAAAIALPGTTALPDGNIGPYKNRLRLGGDFLPRTVAPAVFYVLDRSGEQFQSTTLGGAEAMAVLMANSYHARFGAQVFHGETAAALMKQCAALAGSVPVRILRIPAGLDRLAALVEFVARDVG